MSPSMSLPFPKTGTGGPSSSTGHAPPAQHALIRTGQNVHISILLLVLLLGSSFTRGLYGTRWKSLQCQKRSFSLCPYSWHGSKYNATSTLVHITFEHPI